MVNCSSPLCGLFVSFFAAAFDAAFAVEAFAAAFFLLSRPRKSAADELCSERTPPRDEKGGNDVFAAENMAPPRASAERGGTAFTPQVHADEDEDDAAADALRALPPMLLYSRRGDPARLVNAVRSGCTDAALANAMPLARAA
jgi:hypothetical protein